MFQIAVWLVFFLLTFPPRNSNTNNPYHVVTAWTTRTIPTLQTPIARSRSSITYCQRKLLSSKLSPPWVPLSATAGNGDNNEEKDDQSEEYDDLQGYKKTFSIDENEKDNDPKLGIDIGSMLDPLSQKEADELKAAATEVINDAVAAGLDDIEAMRAKMKKDIDKKKAQSELKSEIAGRRESDRLMNKIDALTDNFLSKTETSRSSTKLAAAADKASVGKGVDLGSWGVLGGGAAVQTSGRGGNLSPLLGSVSAAVVDQYNQLESSSSSDSNEETAAASNYIPRVIVLADAKQDEVAKQLLPDLMEDLKSALPGLQLTTYTPTDTVPLGGDNAAAAILFLTSYTDKSGLLSQLDRLLRRTMQPGGVIGTPPTQLVLISTVGTSRTNKMPYSMQNLMGGGKLEKRKQMEDAVVNQVKQRVVEPALDYTIAKLGDLKKASQDFSFLPGDVLDGGLDIPTACQVLTQAICYQPTARNSTFSVTGCLPTDERQQAAVLDDAFLRLDGPELLRLDDVFDREQVEGAYEPLVEYLHEWASLLATTGKGLTTPVEAFIPSGNTASPPPGVDRQTAAVELLFLPTATGKNYFSAEEERKLDEQGSFKRNLPSKRLAKEGGIAVFVEVTNTGALRLRAKRCNYADDAVIKELSEATILSALRKSIDVWKKEHAAAIAGEN